MYLLIVDTETTGLPDDEKAEMIEFACALYSVERKTTLWQLGSVLFSEAENPCESINGISTEDMRESLVLQDFQHGFWELVENSPECSAVVAHNAEFDKHFVTKAGMDIDLPWVCSVGFEYEKSRGSKRLSHLATDYGLPGHRQSHRALDDVLLLCQLLSKLNNLEEQVQDALKPQGLWQAGVTFHTKELAKAQGFHWDGQNKRWLRKWPLDKPWPEDLPFKVTLVEKL